MAAIVEERYSSDIEAAEYLQHCWQLRRPAGQGRDHRDPWRPGAQLAAGHAAARDHLRAWRGGTARAARSRDRCVPDRRQREPYVNHLLRVTIRIISHYRVRDSDVACAALLHDAVEDHADDLAPGGGQHDALAMLAEEFGDRVSGLVAAVTNPEYDAGRDENEQYREHVVAGLEGNAWARVIKASDLTDNAVGLFHTTGPKIGKLAGKYGPLLPAVRGLILRADTPLDADVKDRIAAQLGNAEERLAAIGRRAPG